jgi:hypothetical protein
MANYYINETFQGLGTVTIKVPDTDTYVIKGKIQAPGRTNPSQVVTTVNINGSPVYTGAAGSKGFYTRQSLTAADVITIVFTSALASDAALNVIKSTISVNAGLS